MNSQSILLGGIPTSAGALLLRLELRKTNITEQGVSHLSFHLKHSSAISEFVLSDGSIRYIHVLLPIAEALQMNTSLTNLSLHHMSLHHTEQNGSSLTKMLQENKSLTHLDLSNNSTFSDSGARCIFEGLQHNTTLVNLNLSQTGIAAITSDTARSLTKMLQVNKSLTHLDLSYNCAFANSEARCIFEGLQNDSTTLVNLNLKQTGIASISPETAIPV